MRNMFGSYGKILDLCKILDAGRWKYRFLVTVRLLVLDGPTARCHSRVKLPEARTRLTRAHRRENAMSSPTDTSDSVLR